MTLTTLDINRRLWLVIPFPTNRTSIPVSWEQTNWDLTIKQPMKHCKIITKGANHSVMHFLVDKSGNTILKDSSLYNLHRRILKSPNIKLINNNQPFPTDN